MNIIFFKMKIKIIIYAFYLSFLNGALSAKPIKTGKNHSIALLSNTNKFDSNNLENLIVFG